jgi:hypothetical protein
MTSLGCPVGNSLGVIISIDRFLAILLLLRILLFPSLMVVFPYFSTWRAVLNIHRPAGEILKLESDLGVVLMY